MDSLARNILVVDDDDDLRDQVVAYLAQHGYQTLGAENGRVMNDVLAQARVDLVILDVVMPGEDGLAICRRLADRNDCAIVIMSALSEELDRILGLELGADDYLPKSCSPRELLARVRAVLRRLDDVRNVTPRRPKAYHFAGFEVDAPRRQLRAPGGAVILLTGGEFSLLSAFLDHPQQILTREELLEHAHGGATTGDVLGRAVDVQISRLRRKLHACSPDEIIRTCRGAGYMLDAKVRHA